MRISVVIPCLNEAAEIVKTLQPLQPLRQAGHEVILVDGGSHDPSAELATPWVDQLLYSSPGRARQMNAGAAVAAGELIWFLHADTAVTAEVIAALQGLGSRPPEFWGRFDVRLSGQHGVLRVVEFMMNWRSRLSGIATGDQGQFVTAGLFRQVAGFPDLPLMEDIALSRALKSHAAPLCLRQQLITSSRRWEERGIFTTILLMWRLRLAYAMGASPADLARRYR